MKTIRTAWALSGMLVVLGTALLLAAPAVGKRYALLVGVKEYNHAKLKSLDYSENDVVELAKLLRVNGYEVVLLCDSAGDRDDRRKPTLANIRTQLDALLERTQRHDTMLVGLAGHGLQFEGKDDSFFCPSDANPSPDKARTLLSLKELYQKLDDSGAGVKLLLVDACRDDPQGGRGRGVDADHAPRPPRGVAALFSCSAGERAFETGKYGHGVFFYHLLEGLRGKARNTDDEVTWDTLSGYVRTKVARDVPLTIGEGAKQHPNAKADLSGESPVLVALKDSGSKPPDLDRTTKDNPGRLEVPLRRGGKLVLEFVRIPKGTFLMGSPASERADLKKRYGYDPKAEDEYEVEITRDYWLGKTTVTRGQFRAFVEDEGYRTEGEQDGKGGYSWNERKWEQKPEFIWKNPGFDQTDEHPVVLVSWNDARAFCDWVKRQTGKAVRLPTEAEWERACRGGERKGRFFFGDDEEELARYGNVADASAKKKFPGWTCIQADDGYVFTAPVKSYRPNQYGLYDMHGNVWQWCQDWYDKDYYGNSNKRDPQGPNNGTLRVLRGGSWINPARNCRAAHRSGHEPAYRYAYIGFRLAFRLD